jgi:ribosomal protein L16 Arg81 hydroxylase
LRIIDDVVFDKICEDPDFAFYGRNLVDTDVFTWQHVKNYLNDTFHLGGVSLINDDGDKINFSPCKHDAWPYDLFSGLEAGNSFLLANMERVNPKVHFISNIMSLVFDTWVTTNVYGGFSDQGRSFPIHADDQIVLICQMVGQSEWFVYNEEWDLTPSTQVPDEGLCTTAVHTILNEGDVLYIPLRRYHKCIPMGSRLSLSVSVENGVYKQPRTDYYGWRY